MEENPWMMATLLTTKVYDSHFITPHTNIFAKCSIPLLPFISSQSVKGSTNFKFLEKLEFLEKFQVSCICQYLGGYTL